MQAHPELQGSYFCPPVGRRYIVRLFLSVPKETRVYWHVIAMDGASKFTVALDSYGERFCESTKDLPSIFGVVQILHFLRKNTIFGA